MLHSRPWLAALTAVTFLFGVTTATLVSNVNAQEQIELRVWDEATDPRESDNNDAVYAAFMEQNPNITIVREAIASEQLRDTVKTALSSGTGPDIVSYGSGPGFAGLLADAGLLLPLDDYAAQYNWFERVAAPAVEATTIDGVFYGMPNQTDLMGMYYNQTLIDQEGLTVPQTLDELVVFCGAAKEKGYVPMAFADNPGWQAGHQFSMTSAQTIGPEAMHALLFDNEGSWNTPEVVTAIEAYFVTLRDAGCFPDDVVAINYDDGNSLFLSGQALLHSTGSWLAGEIVEQMPDSEVGFMPFPEIEGGHGRVWVTGVGSAWYIASASPHPDEAAALIDYLISQEASERWVEVAQWAVPFDIDLTNLDISPLHRQILEALQTAGDEGVLFGQNIDVLAPAPFNDMMISGFQAILVGDKTAEQQAADLQAAWEEGMAES